MLRTRSGWRVSSAIMPGHFHAIYIGGTDCIDDGLTTGT